MRKMGRHFHAILSFYHTKDTVRLLGFLILNYFQGDFLLFAVFAFEMEISEALH